jgi:hypothetical protein
MPRREARQARNDFASSECPGQRHPQCAAQAVRAARCIFGVVEITKDLPRPFEKHPAGFGRRDAPCGAQEKLHTQPRFEVCHHSRYRRLRHP